MIGKEVDGTSRSSAKAAAGLCSRTGLHRPAAAATSQRILVDPAGWMRAPDPVGQLGVLRAAVFTGRRLRLRYRPVV